MPITCDTYPEAREAADKLYEQGYVPDIAKHYRSDGTPYYSVTSTTARQASIPERTATQAAGRAPRRAAPSREAVERDYERMPVPKKRKKHKKERAAGELEEKKPKRETYTKLGTTYQTRTRTRLGYPKVGQLPPKAIAQGRPRIASMPQPGPGSIASMPGRGGIAALPERGKGIATLPKPTGGGMYLRSKPQKVERFSLGQPST